MPINKDLDKLISKALAKGADANGVYHLFNKSNKEISADEAKKYFVSKNYVAITTLEKEVTIFGVVVKIIDKIDFITMDNFQQYAFSLMNKNRQVEYSQLKNTGAFIMKVFDKHRDFKSRYIENAYWSGQLANGLLTGGGVGLVNIDGDWCYFEGYFAGGFPVQNTILYKLSPTMALSRDNLVAYEYKDVVGYKNASGNLGTATREYAKHQYNTFKRDIDIEFSRALTLNNHNGEFLYFLNEKEKMKKGQTTVNDFIEPYTYWNYDPDGYLPKAIELQELYQVLDGLCVRSDRDYIYESILWGTCINLANAEADTAAVGKAWRITLNRASYSESSFKEFYKHIKKAVSDKYDAVFDNINRRIAQYNSMQKNTGALNSPSSFSSSRSSDDRDDSDGRDNSDDSYDSRSVSDNSSTSSSDSLSCTVRLKNPDRPNCYYNTGWITVYFYPHRYGYKDYWVDDKGKCTITWDPDDRGEYIDRIVFQDYDRDCTVCINTPKDWYEVSGIEMRDKGNYTFTAHRKK